MGEPRFLRLTASRPVYRRGGLQLSHTPLDVEKGQDGGILSPTAMLALLRDPVVHIRTSEDGEAFDLLTPEYREEIASNIEALLTAEDFKVSNANEDKIPRESGAVVGQPAAAPSVEDAAQTEAKEEPKVIPATPPVAAPKKSKK